MTQRMNAGRVFYVLLIGFSFALSAAAQGKKIVVGILPTYDASGQSYGTTVSQMLTGILYDEFAANSAFSPTFLNPGGMYQPSGGAWTIEYIDALDRPVDLILATTFSEPDMPDHGDYVLHLRSEILNRKTGEVVKQWTSNKPMKDKKILLDYTRFHSYSMFGSHSILDPSREFRKQPLGKAAMDLAHGSAAQAVVEAKDVPATGLAITNAGAAKCKLRLKVNFQERHSVSKSYSCIINDRDESLGIKEGVLEVEEPGQKLNIRIELGDAPYKMPKQPFYLLDPVLDCTRGENQLDVNIGPAGEALLKWH